MSESSVNLYLMNRHQSEEIKILREALQLWKMYSPIPKHVEQKVRDADLFRHEILKLEGRADESPLLKRRPL